METTNNHFAQMSEYNKKLWEKIKLDIINIFYLIIFEINQSSYPLFPEKICRNALNQMKILWENDGKDPEKKIEDIIKLEVMGFFITINSKNNFFQKGQININKSKKMIFCLYNLCIIYSHHIEKNNINIFPIENNTIFFDVLYDFEYINTIKNIGSSEKEDTDIYNEKKLGFGMIIKNTENGDIIFITYLPRFIIENKLKTKKLLKILKKKASIKTQGKF